MLRFFVYFPTLCLPVCPDAHVVVYNGLSAVYFLSLKARMPVLAPAEGGTGMFCVLMCSMTAAVLNLSFVPLEMLVIAGKP